MNPSLLRVICKDSIDFAVIVTITCALTLSLYYLLPSFTPVVLSFYFFEQFLELFFQNPSLVVWFLGLGFGVTLIYYLFGAMLFMSSFGGFITSLTMVDRKTNKPLHLKQAIIAGIGAYLGVVALMIGPLSAWWLDTHHQGWAEKISRTRLRYVK